MADIDTAAFRREWGGCGFTVTDGMTADPEDSCVSCVVQTLCAEIDRLRGHSVWLNAIGWRLAEAVGDVGPEDVSVESDPAGRLERLIAERDEAVAARDRWRDSWDRGDWTREQWERERAQEVPS